MYKKIFKRLFDIVLSLILLSLLLSFMIIIFFLIWLFIGFEIFKQKWLGLKRKIFNLYKFKTLYDIPPNISKKKDKVNLEIFYVKLV
tara:strand:- start:669 stop:929 length:261 start_codon:yes stop_codon:yes gene_type:complete